MTRNVFEKDMTRRKAVGLAAVAGIIAALGGMSGCTSEEHPTDNGNGGGSYSHAVKLDKPASTGNPVLGFAADTSAVLLSGNMENTCYSPLSLYLCTALLAAGAKGESLDAVLQALRVDDIDDLLEICNEVDQSFVTCGTEAGDSAIVLANSIWVDKDRKFTDEYLSTAADKLRAEARTVDFGTSAANKEMSKWVSDFTKGLLNPQFDTADDEIMALINTVYFKDGWSDPFDSGATSPQTFYGFANESETDFLHATNGGCYAKVGECLVADRGFRNTGTWMRFILPSEGTTPADLFENPDNLAEILSVNLETSADVNWSIPKFNFDNKFDLVPTLANLGMGKVFSPSSDFDSMVLMADGSPESEEIYVSSVEQGTHIGLDEDGVEAAAYTVMNMKEAAVAPEEVETVDMNLNRPFAYAIMAGNDTPLFVGAIYDFS